MSHDAVFCDCVCLVFFLHEQVAHQHVERKVGGRMLHGVEGFIHCGTQASDARQLIDAIHGFKHGTGLSLHDHICKWGNHVAVLLWHLFAHFMQLFTPVGTDEQVADVVAYFAQDGFILLVFMCFDQGLVLLTDLVRFFGGDSY